MFTKEKARDLLDSPTRDAEGQEIGRVDAIYVDNETDKPEFAAIALDGGSRVVPLAEAREDDGALLLPYRRDAVTAAPTVGTDQGLTQEEEAELYAHYGLDFTVSVADEDRIDVHSDAGEDGVSAVIQERQGVWVQRDPLEGEER